MNCTKIFSNLVVKPWYGAPMRLDHSTSQPLAPTISFGSFPSPSSYSRPSSAMVLFLSGREAGSALNDFNYHYYGLK